MRNVGDSDLWNRQIHTICGTRNAAPQSTLKSMKVSQTSLFESHFKPGRCLRSLKDVRAQIDHSFRKSLSERAKRASCATSERSELCGGGGAKRRRGKGGEGGGECAYGIQKLSQANRILKSILMRRARS